MKNVLKLLASFLLLINGIGGLYGGWNLITHPDGSSLQLPLYHLQNSPFDNYLIPGFLLFAFIGLFSFFVLAATILRPQNSSALLTVQGVILIIGIIAQLMIMGEFNLIAIVYFTCGVILIVEGLILNKKDHREMLRKQMYPSR